MADDPTSESAGWQFKQLLEHCLHQARLNKRTLHRELGRHTPHGIPETTIESWMRPHSRTGLPNLPSEDTLQLLAGWLCARDGVTVTPEDLWAARRADKAAQAARRSARRPASGARPLPEPVSAYGGGEALATGVVVFVAGRSSGEGGYSQALHLVLAEAAAAHGGAVVSAHGGRPLAAFVDAAGAVRAAAAVQRAPGGERLGASIAVHSGRVVRTSTGYAGLPLQQVTWMSAAAHPGQIVVSEAARTLLGPEVADGGTLVDVGLIRLRDLSAPQRLFELRHPDRTVDFPPLRSLDEHHQNLPLQLTSFIGRTGEIEQLRNALGEHRLCTLVGAGGAGKTRLALRVAAELVENFDTVWVVDLASTPGSELVAQAVAETMGVREGGTGTYAARPKRAQRSLTARLTDHLQHRQVLLLLDNCEHVVESCAMFVDELLRSCPGLHVLCTSREPLGLAGEFVYGVPPLATPPRSRTLSADEIGGYESVQLFLDRAAQRRPDLRLDGPNIEAIMQICQRVEGSALAIELAAARVKLLSPRQILELLEDRFALLNAGSRTAAARHRTLRAMIDWSYDDLSPSQQMLLRRLSVFVGGFELSAAQHVCSGNGLERFEILDLLGMLVDKSLVETDQHAGVIRYRLLETIRAYALEKRAQCGEEVELQVRHRDWYIALAEEAEPALTGRDQGRWLDLLELEHDNLRAALEPAANAEDIQEPLRLAAALGHFWLVRGFLTEGRAHLERALARGGPGRSVLRAKALAVAGNLALFDADDAAAAARSEEALELSGELGYRRGEAWALRTLGRVALGRARFAEARDMQHLALAISRELGDAWGTAFSLTNVANLELLEGTFHKASEHYEESLAVRQSIDDAWGLTWSLFRLGVLRTWQGTFGDAQRLFDEGLARCRRLGYRGGEVLTLLGLGEAAHVQCDQPAAERHYLEAQTKARDLEDQTGVSLSVIGLANVAIASGDQGAARELLSSEEAGSALSTVATQAALLRAQAGLAATVGDGVQAVGLHVQVLGLRQHLADARAMTESLEDLALLCFAGRDAQLAASLLAPARSFRRSAGAPVPPLYREDLDRVIASLRGPGQPQGVHDAWEERSSQPIASAVALARSRFAPLAGEAGRSRSAPPGAW